MRGYRRLCAVLYTRCTSAPILLHVRPPGTSARKTRLVVGFDFPVASRYVGLATTSRGRINGGSLARTRESIGDGNTRGMYLSLSTYLPSPLGRYKQVGEKEVYRARPRLHVYVHLTVGEQYIYARIRVYTYNHGRAATLIRDNRVGVYGRMDGLRGTYTSVTHSRPDEFRVIPVS